ncbi:cation-translocating P-type ATPase [Acholeplasma hippikon]|uniref:Calcium-transporting ATPase n=1 Tax=Acholeplasma hippikon TaxID=264636 RepID=A0A449BJJ1_9MOLU|nr:cation-translocating P-type ATPase [Acholeplasma hippikon]VEU82497.1 Calcium-transporting ATPase [Acholeplasma hippikon]
MKKIYQLSTDEILKELGTSNQGLSTEEASKRLSTNGKNKLDEAKKRHFILRFLDQFKDFMVIVLLVAAAISFIAAILENKMTETFEGVLILAIVVINALLGLMQEAKAEKALESIKKMSAPHATVIRDGKEVVLDVEDIVVGDIIVLQAGDYIPADVRIIQSVNLKADESALTGEPVPVEKITDAIHKDEVPLGDRVNLGFMSTVVTYGRGLAVVTSVGMQTEIGKIAEMLSNTETEETPLQKSIAQLGKTLAIIAFIIVGVIFAIQIITALVKGVSPDWLEAFMSSVALAVAAIPEGLPAIITIVLSLGMTNLVKQRAIMRTLPAVETLGSTSIICSDKTGTLTQNVMTITDTYLYQQNDKVSDLKSVEGSLKKLVDFGVLCNDTKVRVKDDKFLKIGDPTEIALTDLAINTGFNPLDILANFPRVHELPFDSNRKLMTTVHEIDGKFVSITKGAPDIVLSRSVSYEVNGHVETINDKVSNVYLTENNNMADRALRVLAVAYKVFDKNTDITKLLHTELENDLTMLGLVGMIDPARPEVKDAIVETKRAGITTIMITGDHKNTAVAIATELGILENGHLAITGKELDQMSDEEFDAKLSQIRVYARVSPENKVRIVTAWKKTGLIVAMTGDGVNDAPSIKKADIGIAMGITGTEVAKGAADMILTDDNFATIVGAVSEGRAIFANIKKAIHFLLSCNIGEIVTILLGVTLGLALFPNVENLVILSAVQILWVNLVTDSFMAIAIGLDPKEPDIMNYPPRDNSKSIFADGLGFRIGWQGIMIGSLTFAAFFIGYNIAPADHELIHAQTLTFMVLSISQLFHSFNVRSEKYSIFQLKPNKYLIMAFFGCLALQLVTVFVPAIAENVFKVDDVHYWRFIDWMVVIGLSITPLVVVEIQKLIKRFLNK